MSLLVSPGFSWSLLAFPQIRPQKETETVWIRRRKLLSKLLSNRSYQTLGHRGAQAGKREFSA